MDYDELKEKHQWLKKLNLDEKTFKRYVILLAVVLILVVFLLCVKISKTRQAKAAQVQQVEASEEYVDEIMEIPPAETDDILDATSQVNGVSRIKNGNRSEKLRELYEQTEFDPYSSDDILGDIEAAAENGGGYRKKDRPLADDSGMSLSEKYAANSAKAQRENERTSEQSTEPSTRRLNRGGTRVEASYEPAVPTSSAVAQATSEPGRRSQRQQQQQSYSDIEEPAPAEAPKPQQQSIRKSGGISSLDDEWGTVDGIGGLDNEDQYVTVDLSKPVKVMFVRDQKIKSGQRVALRLLDDIAAEGMLIPKNTHISANCTIGDRLKITVSNIEINGKIITLDYTAYDNDGNEGLYCPETKAKKNTKEVSQQATALGQSILSSAVGGVAGIVGNVAGTAVTAGSNLIRQAGNDVTAQVNAGYTFYLLKNEF